MDFSRSWNSENLKSRIPNPCGNGNQEIKIHSFIPSTTIEFVFVSRSKREEIMMVSIVKRCGVVWFGWRKKTKNSFKMSTIDNIHVRLCEILYSFQCKWENPNHQWHCDFHRHRHCHGCCNSPVKSFQNNVFSQMVFNYFSFEKWRKDWIESLTFCLFVCSQPSECWMPNDFDWPCNMSEDVKNFTAISQYSTNSYRSNDDVSKFFVSFQLHSLCTVYKVQGEELKSSRNMHWTRVIHSHKSIFVCKSASHCYELERIDTSVGCYVE